MVCSSIARWVPGTVASGFDAKSWGSRIPGLGASTSGVDSALDTSALGISALGVASALDTSALGISALGVASALGACVSER